MVEIMVGVAIMFVLTILSVRPWGSTRQREDLLKVGNQLVNFLKQVQAEAKLYGEVRGICFKQDAASGQHMIRVYRPTLASGSILPADNDCTLTELTTRGGPEYKFGTDVRLCENCDSKIALDKSVFFDKDGFVMEQNGNRSVHEICFFHPKMPSGTRAREIEIGINGDIHLLAQTETGKFSGVVANQGNCQ